jgi:hypothetical protein
LLVLRVGVGVQDFGLGERFEDGAVGRETFVDAEGEAGVDERAWGLDLEVVESGAGLAADEEDIFEAGGGDEGDTGAFSFEQRVGRDGAAVGDFGLLAGEGADAFEYGARGVVRGGAEFVDVETAVVEEEEIREGSAGVDADAEWGLGQGFG